MSHAKEFKQMMEAANVEDLLIDKNTIVYANQIRSMSAEQLAYEFHDRCHTVAGEYECMLRNHGRKHAEDYLIDIYEVNQFEQLKGQLI